MNFSASKLLAMRRIATRSRPAFVTAGVWYPRGTRITSQTAFHSFKTKSLNHYTAKSFSSLAVEDTNNSDEPRKTIPFRLADIGEGIAEVELLQWYVSPGDHVAQFDRVCEVQSDKATVEITSRYDGIVKSLEGKVGDMVKVGTPLMHISIVDTGGGGTPQATGEATSEKTSEGPSASTTLNNVDDEADKLHIPSYASHFELRHDDDFPQKKEKVLATPAVRKLGMEHNLDLSSIIGTGPKGRVLKADVLKIIGDKQGTYVPEADTAAVKPAAEPVNAPAAAPALVIEEDTTIDIKGYNRMMIKSMTASLQVPHMNYGDEINMNEMLKCRKELQPLAEAHGVKLSLLPFAIKAVSLALKDYPALNSSINAEEYKITYKANHNIGVAMDTPRGLAVPVVKGCQNLSVLEIAAELNRLKQLCMESSLSEDDISDATFSISNMGAIGGTYMAPVVVPPQVAIGAMGRIQRLPRFVDDNVIEEVNIMQISWGGDHRVIDGATLARFSNQWKEYMENPMTMVFSMK